MFVGVDVGVDVDVAVAVAVTVAVFVGVAEGVPATVAVAVGVAVDVAVGVGVPPAAIGAKATPRKAVFAAAVPIVESVPVIVVLKPLVSVTVYNEPPPELAPVVPYNVTVAPLVLPVKPLTDVAATEPFAVHVPDTSEYLKIAPGGVSSAT